MTFFKLARVADDATLTHQRTAANKRAMPYFAVLADYRRPADERRRKDMRRLVSPDAIRKTNVVAAQFFAEGINEIAYAAQGFPGVYIAA